MNRFIDKKLFVRRFLLVLLDIFFINLASIFAILTRFDFRLVLVEQRYWEVLLNYFILDTAITIAIFFFFKLYHSLWRYAGAEELINILLACGIAGVIQLICLRLLKFYVPRSFYPLHMVYLIILITGCRFLYRFGRILLNRYHPGRAKSRMMIIGAGEAANVIIKEIVSSTYLEGIVVCAIDDNIQKKGSYIQGVKILGGRKIISETVKRYGITDIIIAMPSVSRKSVKEILEICKETSCSLKILPGMYQLINEEVSVNRLKSVEIEDLLGRESIDINIDDIMNYVGDQIILITGGGGSIGSELSRQIAKHHPKKIIIFDIYENSAYEIQQELLTEFPELDILVLIGSVRDNNRLEDVFKTYSPNIVYHAAAHKHVPLMETSPNEVIKNNVFGTLNLVNIADKYNVNRFIMISTDKAVNPTNIMGASKRICEMIIQTFNKCSRTEFVAVRFGNVLGSNGSVIPMFKKQIAAGGPVTVTHPDVIRYFMTISEAVSLVLQAGAYASGGEIFVLDMGEPVRIVDLANNLIRLSGFTPDKDIVIEYVGLRPGEKLYEELLMDEEGLQETKNRLIHIGKPIMLDEEAFWDGLLKLKLAINDEACNIREIVKRIVVTYKPEEEE